MVARDDSVIRGSLIACLIFLVLSLALNFFFYRWGDTQAQEATSAKTRAQGFSDNIRNLEGHIETYEKMLGIGQWTEEEFKSLANSSSGNANLDTIAAQFVQDMAYLGPPVDLADIQTRNYPELPKFLVNAIRSNNDQINDARGEVKQIQTQADADVQNAKQAQAMAETRRDEMQKTLESEQQKFTDDRNRINQQQEETRDSLTKMSREYTNYQKVAKAKEVQLVQKSDQLKNTIETQRQQLNVLRNPKFETTQGEVRYVMATGDVVTINLGSADALRPGVTFGVIAREDATRLQDAEVKATIQVTRVRSQHLAEARVVAFPSLDSPIIEGDLIYSPFWAPGRRVKIALAGDIDIDGDDRPDNQALQGMIKAAGAEVAATISAAGAVEGTLDATIRFLVIGETPELDATDDLAAQKIAAMGEVRAKATELGLTVIPAWKLQAYLRTIDDTLTTPLGSAVRADDFPPERIPGPPNRLPTTLPEMYKQDTEKLQKDNTILSP
jgi:hypothetical protein